MTIVKDVIYPAPRQIEVFKTSVDLTDRRWVVLPSGCSRSLRERIQDGAKRLGPYVNRELEISPVVPHAGGLFVELILVKRGIPDQGYRLAFTNETRRIEASSEAGLLYGYQALAQWIETYRSKPIAFAIEDAPDFSVRGVMLDVSRCKVPTMATCKHLIDHLAGLRINQIQLYIEHTFAFSAHPIVWADSSPFTHAEILELDQYCKDRFIELVPNLNSFGHVERYLRHPEYRYLAECPDMENCSTLAPNQTSLRFLKELYDEYLPNFSSSLFNVGCDETYELGKGRSKKRADQMGTTAVYLEFLKKIHKLVLKRGRRMQFWGDIILHQPELITQLPKDLIALNWGYEANHPFDKQCPAFAEAGVDFYVCPGTSAWCSITGRTDNCLANLENAARNGQKHGASGYLITDWGDGGHYQVLPISYLGFAAGAGYSWSLASNRDADLASVISRHFFADQTRGLGQFILDLGRTPNRISGIQRGNQSAIHRLLFCLHQPKDLAKVSSVQFTRAHAWLDKLASGVVEAQPRCRDRDLVMHEFQHTLDMARYALDRGCAVKAGKADTRQLQLRRGALRESHQEQWLARNRLGGLRESSTYLL